MLVIYVFPLMVVTMDGVEVWYDSSLSYLFFDYDGSGPANENIGGITWMKTWFFFHNIYWILYRIPDDD